MLDGNLQPRIAPHSHSKYPITDQPADKRLRPWVILGSIILMVISAGMIITPVVHYGSLSSLWGIFAAGCVLSIPAILGLVAGFTSLSKVAFIYQVTLSITLLGSLAALIINACFLGGDMDNRCTELGVTRYSQTCENVRLYHIIVYTVFGPLVVLWVPALLVSASYLARTTNLYKKREYGSIRRQGPLPIPVGTSRL